MDLVVYDNRFGASVASSKSLIFHFLSFLAYTTYISTIMMECTIANSQVSMILTAVMKKLETTGDLLDDTPDIEYFPVLVHKFKG